MRMGFTLGKWQVFAYVAAGVLSLFYLLPVISMVLTSLKTPTELFSAQIFPARPSLANYWEVLQGAFGHYALNSLILTVCSVAISTFLGILAAYGISKFEFRGKNAMFLSVLFIRLLPRAILLVPYYIFLSQLHLTNTFPGLVAVYVAFALPIAIWLLTGFFKTVPREIEEAAQIDGCSTWQIIWRIVVPMCAPGIAVAVLFVFIDGWDQFTLPLLLTREATRPLAVGLVLYRQDALVLWHLVMAAAVLMTLPFIVLFAIFQKHLIGSMFSGAVKE